MYTVAVTRDFIARHYLIGGDWGNENLLYADHYVTETSIESETLDEQGYLVDIVKIETELDKIISYFRDRMLNDLTEFNGLNPSIEHFSRILCEKLLHEIQPPGTGVLQIKLWENNTCWAAYCHQF